MDLHSNLIILTYFTFTVEMASRMKAAFLNVSAAFSRLADLSLLERFREVRTYVWAECKHPPHPSSPNVERHVKHPALKERGVL